MFIYNAQSTDPIRTIKTLPPLHPFRSEATKLGIDLNDHKTYIDKIKIRTDCVTLEESSLFSNDELKMIDDEFIRMLRKESYPEEGKHGISVRQLQNIIRDTAASSDGKKMTVNQFIQQLQKIIVEGRDLHPWLRDGYISSLVEYPVKERFIGNYVEQGEITSAALGVLLYEGSFMVFRHIKIIFPLPML